MKKWLVVLAAVLVIAAAVGQGVAAAGPTTIQFNAAFGGHYSCPGPCATATDFSLTGLAHPDSHSLGTLTYTGGGTVLSYDPLSNCFAQSLYFAFTTQNGDAGKDTFYVSTISDTACLTTDPNVLSETATFDITGGTGRFAGATGSGTFAVTSIVHPQKGSGTLAATITY